MPTEDVTPNNVIQISGRVRSPITNRNVPSARILVQRNHLSEFTQLTEEERFEAIFRNMDDNTFWHLIEIIEGSGYSAANGSSEIAKARQSYQAMNPTPKNS